MNLLLSKTKLSFAYVCILLIAISMLHFLIRSSSRGISTPTPYNPVWTGNRSNIVFVYSGRWEFLRIQLPYLYRDLRKNRGVLDKVQFIMVNYDRNTLDRLINFTESANAVLKENVFSIHHMGHHKPVNHNQAYMRALNTAIKEMLWNPLNRYFKLDDDVVYIHPEAFSNMIKLKRSDCAVHYFNTAGSNWRCSWLHQRYGIYTSGLNSKNLTFEFSPHANCGWKSIECANLTLQTFLHLYSKSQLERFFFDVEYLKDRKRFSITAYMLDYNSTDIFDLKKQFESRPNKRIDDEAFLGQYFRNTLYPPCVVGKALVVHFGYRTVSNKLVEMGLLQKFNVLPKQTKHSFHMPPELWQLL